MDLYTETVNKIMQQCLFEDTKKDFHRIGIFPGAFKPPHIGHYQVVEQACKENDEVFLYISKEPRFMNEEDTDAYKKQKAAAYRKRRAAAKKNERKQISESSDIGRYANIFTDKYTGNLGNIKVVNPLFGDVSASLIRKAIKIRDVETIYKNIPNIPEKGEIVDILLSNPKMISIEQTQKIWEIYKPHIETKSNALLHIEISSITPVRDTYTKVLEINESRIAPNTEINLYVGDK